MTDKLGKIDLEYRLQKKEGGEEGDRPEKENDMSDLQIIRTLQRCVDELELRDNPDLYAMTIGKIKGALIKMPRRDYT